MFPFMAKRISMGTLEKPGRRRRVGKKKEWIDCLADDLRLFAVGDVVGNGDGGVLEAYDFTGKDESS